MAQPDRLLLRTEERTVAAGKRLAPHLRALDSREEKLDRLLEHYRDAQETLQLGEGPGSGPGDRLLLMPDVWNHSYRRLEVLLGFMREVSRGSTPEFRGMYGHVCRWYLRCERRRVPVTRRDKKGREFVVVTANGPQYEIVVRRPGADPVVVLRGLGWLSGHFGGEIDLPKDMLEVA